MAFSYQILSRVKPLRVIYGFADRIVDGSNKPIPTALANIAKDAEWLEDEEGRVLTMELDDFYVVACYVPNAGMKLERLEWKCEQWNETMRGFLKVGVM